MSCSAELREAAAPVWEAQIAHPFVRGIGDGTLPEDKFRFYVRQDYLFLIDYGRLLALAAARAPRLEWMRRFSALAQSVLETERTAPATDAYCDFLLRTAALGDFAELVAALLPDLSHPPYADIGERLAAAGLPDDERYAEWIAMYASPEFGQLAAWCRELTDAVADDVAGPGRRRMHAAFRASSEHEIAFWESAWRSQCTAPACPTSTRTRCAADTSARTSSRSRRPAAARCSSTSVVRSRSRRTCSRSRGWRTCSAGRYWPRSAPRIACSTWGRGAA